MIWKLKQCPRCRGDVFLDHDEVSRWYQECLQCGCRHYMPSALDWERRPAKEQRQVPEEVTVESM